MATSKKQSGNYRSAKTGQYVPRDYAKKHTSTTVKEMVARPRSHKGGSRPPMISKSKKK